MPLSFPVPLPEGFKITAAFLNELIAAIQNGSIFTSASFVGDLVTTLDARVDTLEAQMANVAARQSRDFNKEQFTLTAAQSTVILDKVPVLDSEIVALNGMVLAKSNIPTGVTGDYTVSGSTVTLENELALTVEAGDRLVLTYSYEVI